MPDSPAGRVWAVTGPGNHRQHRNQGGEAGGHTAAALAADQKGIRCRPRHRGLPARRVAQRRAGGGGEGLRRLLARGLGRCAGRRTRQRYRRPDLRPLRLQGRRPRGGRCLLVVPDRGRWRLRRAGGGGDLDFALAGGVDIGLDPVDLVGLARAGALATQEMRIYDATPTGFLLGEGCGIVALIRAEDSHATAVPVYADITGWGISSAGNGRAISGPDGLLPALRRAYKRAEADPAHVQLFEGHAAGIAASDLAELTALTSLRADAPPRAAQPAALGSIKANIGHTRAAAGVAGLLKAVLAMSAGTPPPRPAATSPTPPLPARPPGAG